MIETLTSLQLVLGGLLVCAGSVGVARFPDFYNRVHAAGIPGTLGVTALLIAATLHHSVHDGAVYLKPLLTAALLFLTIPLGTEMLARAAYTIGLQPWKGYIRDDTLGKDIEHKEEVE